MKKTLRNLSLFFVGIIAFASTASAQQAFLQVVHNCADPAAQAVDIYINGQKPTQLDDFLFRTATPFAPIPLIPGMPLVVSVNSSSSQNALDGVLYTQNIEGVQAGKYYTVFAEGVVGQGFSGVPGRNIGFNLKVVEALAPSMGGSGSGQVDINVYHGVTDAPAVDVYLNADNTPAISALNYGNNTGYVKLQARESIVTVTATGNPAVVAGKYLAPLQFFEDASAIVFASGFLDTENQGSNDVPSSSKFGLYVVIATGQVIALPSAETSAFVQIVHNASDPAADMVDVYVNGTKLAALDNFAYRSATPFVQLPAGIPILVAVNSADSENINDGNIANFNLGTLETGKYYVVVANGVVGEGFDTGLPNREINFDLYPVEGYEGPDTEGNVKFKVFHGATDVPPVDISLHGTDTKLISALDYGLSSTALEVPAEDISIDLNVTGFDMFKVKYDLPLSAIADNYVTIIASGFGDLEENGLEEGTEIGDARDFRILAVLNDGTVLSFQGEEDETDPGTAKVQIIHNAADPALGSVDIYAFGEKLLDNFEFRDATPFVELPAGMSILLSINSSESENDEDQVLANVIVEPLETDNEYVFIANGVAGQSFSSPNGRDITFKLVQLDGRQLAENADEVMVNIFHGATDAPAVDIYLNRDEVPAVQGLDYLESTGYITLQPTAYIVSISAANQSEYVAEYNAPLTTARGAAAVVFASGFLDPTNQGVEVPESSAFGLYVALPFGMVVQLPLVTTSVENNNPIMINAYPNPTVDVIVVETNVTSNLVITDMMGNIVNSVDNLNAGRNSIPVNELATGRYIMSVTNSNGVRNIMFNVVK